MRSRPVCRRLRSRTACRIPLSRFTESWAENGSPASCGCCGAAIACATARLRPGLVERRQFQEIPPRVEYRITSVGAGALPGLELLAKWIKNNFE